jgi:gas vesicle protein
MQMLSLGEQMKKFGDSRVVLFISVFAIGGLLGAVIGLMAAPQSGRALRRKLQEAGVGYFEGVNRNLENFSVITKKAVKALLWELETPATQD